MPSNCLRIVSLGFVFYAYGMVLTQSFNGAGDTWTPTWINVGCFWCWEIPLACLLALYLGLGPTGRLSGGHDRLLDGCRRERDPLQARAVEAETRLTVSPRVTGSGTVSSALTPDP